MSKYESWVDLVDSDDEDYDKLLDVYNEIVNIDENLTDWNWEDVDNLLDAFNKYVPVIDVGIADSCGFYYLDNKNDDWMVFVHLFHYVSPLGYIVAIPVEEGEKLIERWGSRYQTFGDEAERSDDVKDSASIQVEEES